MIDGVGNLRTTLVKSQKSNNLVFHWNVGKFIGASNLLNPLVKF